MEATIPDETLIRLLPASCRTFLEYGLPLPAVLALVRRYAGGVLSVPCTVSETHELARVLGLEAARKLVAALKGTSATSPSYALTLRGKD